jgi:hypothetical protein
MSHRALNAEQFHLIMKDISEIDEGKEHLGPVAHEMGLHPSLGGSEVPKVITGRVAKHVMHRADIHQTKRGVDAPHIATEGYQEQQESDFSYPRGRVMTSQRHLHTPTLRRYAEEGPPEHFEDFGHPAARRVREERSAGGSLYAQPVEEHPEGIPYLPEHYEHGGTRWLAEGHHRTVVHRLQK